MTVWRFQQCSSALSWATSFRSSLPGMSGEPMIVWLVWQGEYETLLEAVCSRESDARKIAHDLTTRRMVGSVEMVVVDNPKVFEDYGIKLPSKSIVFEPEMLDEEIRW